MTKSHKNGLPRPRAPTDDEANELEFDTSQPQSNSDRLNLQQYDSQLIDDKNKGPAIRGKISMTKYKKGEDQGYKLMHSRRMMIDKHIVGFRLVEKKQRKD
mmetsp:Transcript_20318/g.17569  ORF Transcript_20318/g.17569 Transcript_20318/m.17569 type:complete len:101 (-) Transcript_20318:824-1126(-)